MAYDMEEMHDVQVGQERFKYDANRRMKLRNTRAHSKDLEAIVTLLEIAALSLTTKPDATFSFEELLRQARELGGDEIAIEERDVKIVLKKAHFVERVAGRLRLR